MSRADMEAALIAAEELVQAFDRHTTVKSASDTLRVFEEINKALARYRAITGESE